MEMIEGRWYEIVHDTVKYIIHYKKGDKQIYNNIEKKKFHCSGYFSRRFEVIRLVPINEIKDIIPKDYKYEEYDTDDNLIKDLPSQKFC